MNPLVMVGGKHKRCSQRALLRPLGCHAVNNVLFLVWLHSHHRQRQPKDKDKRKTPALHLPGFGAAALTLTLTPTPKLMSCNANNTSSVRIRGAPANLWSATVMGAVSLDFCIGYGCKREYERDGMLTPPTSNVFLLPLFPYWLPCSPPPPT